MSLGEEKQVGVTQSLGFIVAFFGTLLFPREDKHIDLHLIGIDYFLTKKANGTLVPMILTDIYRALTSCRAKVIFF